MKKALFISISISLLFLSFCQQKTEEDTGKDVNILKYRVVKKERYRSWNTMLYRIIFEGAGRPTEDQMKRTAMHIWKNGNKNWNAFTVSMYIPGMNVKSEAYARAGFTPKGLKYFKMLDSAEKEARRSIPQPTKKSLLLTLEKRKQIYLEYTMDPLWALDDGLDRVPKKLAEKYMKKYNLTKSELVEILFEGAEKYW